MGADRRILDAELSQLYGRALLAIVRAGDGIELEPGLRLVARLEARSGRPVSIDDLLLAEPLEPAELAAQLRAAASPFRGAGLHASELARMLVRDGISVVLAKGHVSEEEARELVKFAVALGCSVDDVRRMSEHLVPFLAALDETISLDDDEGVGEGDGGARRRRRRWRRRVAARRARIRGRRTRP